MKFVALLPLNFLILSGQLTEEASAKTDAFNVNHPHLETKVVDAMLSSESLEDAINDIKAVKEVVLSVNAVDAFYLRMPIWDCGHIYVKVLA